MDLHGVGRCGWYHQGPVKGLDSISFHPIPWLESSLSTESSRCENPTACFSVLGAAGLSPGRTSFPNLDYDPLSEYFDYSCVVYPPGTLKNVNSFPSSHFWSAAGLATPSTEKQENVFSYLLLSVLRLGPCQWNCVVDDAAAAALLVLD